ncbi:putative Ig domain-containing protein, partial [Kluyvera sp. CHPC 1.2972]|uniref:putative Ig domain-containing protein n=1 Tax=Kluyvera sp. CHPC 1.2972 TaxID=2995176 RepID=UPI003FA586F9
MLWRHLLQTHRNSDEARSAQPSASPAPIGFALEARMMFDGAIAATVNQAENAQPTADAAATAASATTTVANSDSAHAGDGTQTQHTESQDNQKTQGTTDNHTDSDTHAASDITAAGESTRKEVVFIDTSLTDYKTLVDNVPAGIEVELFDGSKDGLSQLVQWAQSHSGYDAIHILSHGGEGEVQLGTLMLNSATATTRAADLATLGSALTESGDLLLYGCDVAENTGQSFVSLLAQLTGADIAASSDLTGDSAQGGDWTLESHTGSIEAAALHVDGYQHLLDVSDTNVEYVLNGISYSTSPVGAGVEVFLDLMPDTDTSLWYVDIDPTTSTITMTMRDGVAAYTGLTGFQLNFSGSTLDAITSITKDNAGTTSAADISASVNGNDKTISFHINTDETSGDGVMVWHFTSTNTVQDTAPTVSGTASNPTFTENGAAVGLFSGVTADTHDTGQTFTGALLTVSNVSANTEYLTIHGVNVALSNGNSILLGGSYGTASVSLSGGIATITLSGATLSNADMSSLLSGITYGNSSDNPGNTTRVVTLTQLTDSGTSHNTVAPNISSAVTVVPVNDAPTGITLSSTAFGQSTGSNAVVATLTATDVDSSAFTYSLVSGAGDTDNARFTLLGDTLRVNASGMSAGTYSVRLQVSDGQATFDKVVLLTVVDDIAPTFDQAPAISNATSGGFTISGSVTEASTLYYVVVPDGASAPTAAQVIAGQNASGGFANASGYQLLNASPYDFSLALSGLAASTMYDVYVVAKDSAGNNTVSVVKMDATTASAGTAPSVSATGSNTVFIGGMAGSVDLFSGVISSTNDSGQTFRSMTLRVEGLSNSGEFINVGGTNLSLDGGDSGTLSGIGKYTIFRTGNFAILVLSELNASSEQINGLVDGLRYGNSNENVTAGIRQVTLVNISDSGSSNNSTVVNISASVNVLASNAALYVTSGSDTGDDAGFGGSIQDDVNDGGGLSLREALYWANQMPGVDRIVFQTDVTLASSIIAPTQTMLIDGQSFTLNGGGYSGFQIATSSITFAIQNLTLTNFTTENNGVSGGVIGFQPNLFGANLRLYNVDMSNNIDNGWGNGIIDMFNLGAGTFNFDFDRVNFHDNILYGVANGDAVIRLFVSGTMQTVSMSITNTAFVNNNQSVYTDPTSTGNAALDFMGNLANPVNTFITLNNVTITGQKHGIIFDYFNNAKIWNLTVRNSVINATDVAMVMNNYGSGTSPTLNVLGTNNLIGTNVLNQLTATDPRLAANAANAINQGDLFYVTGDTDVRGLNRIRQGGVDIGAYESQFAAGTAPQIDLGGTGAGSNYAATVNSGLSNGVPVADALATLIQTDGDSRIWSMTLSLNGVQDSGSELLTLSQSARLAAHAAGINIISDGQTITLTGGATREAFQAVLSAIMYVNTANTPTGGIRTIAVTVNDDAISSATSSLTIITGSPPVVSTPVPPQSVAQNSNLSFTLPAGTFTDPDSDPLTLSATLADGSALPAWLNFDPVTGTFSGTPDNADVGSLSIKVTATDTARNSVSTTFNLTVTNVNDAPVVSMPIPLQAVWQGQSLSFTVPAGTFSDPDGDTLTLSATLTSGSALPTWLHFNPTTGTFSGTPGNADVGNLNIRLTATDPDNASVSTIFNLLVVNVNDAPEVAITIPTQSVAQDGSFSLTVPAGTFVDPDGDTLTLSATLADGSSLPTWLHFDPATHTFTGTPGNSDVGSISIKVTANDGDASVSTTFSLTVINVNDAPVVSTPIPAQGVLQDSSLNFTVPIGTFSDPDGDTLTLSATLADGSSLPTWLHFDPATHTFSGTPGNADVGILSVKLTATDPGNATANTTFNLFVVNVNDAPEVAIAIPTQSVAQDGSFSLTVPAGTF